MASCVFRGNFHGTLGNLFESEMIDDVLDSIPPVQMSGDIPLWDYAEVKLELCARAGIKASGIDGWGDTDRVEFVDDDEDGDEE